jgi:hypothetical protein
MEGILEVTKGSRCISPAVGPGRDVAMREPVKARMNSKTHNIEKLATAEPRDALGESNFFASKSIGQLMAEQHIQPIADLSVLAGAIPDEDVDAFVAEIYQDREI